MGKVKYNIISKTTIPLEALLVPRVWFNTEREEELHPSLRYGDVDSYPPMPIKSAIKDYKRMPFTVDIRVRTLKENCNHINYNIYTMLGGGPEILSRVTGDSYEYHVEPLDEYHTLWNEIAQKVKISLVREVADAITIISGERNKFPAFAIMELYMGQEVTHLLRYRASTVRILAPAMSRGPFISTDSKPFVPWFHIYDDPRPLYDLINDLLPKDPGLFANPGRAHCLFWLAWKELMEKTAW